MAPPAKPLSSRPLFTALPRHAGAAAPASATLLDLATVACNVRATPFPRIRFTGGAAPRAPKRARPEQTMEASAKRARVCGEEEEDAAQSSGGEEQEEPRNEDEEPRKEEESNKEEEESRKEQRSASLEEENARLRRENEAMRRRLALVYAVMRSDASFAAARQRLTAAAQ